MMDQREQTNITDFVAPNLAAELMDVLSGFMADPHRGKMPNQAPHGTAGRGRTAVASSQERNERGEFPREGLLCRKQKRGP